MAVPAVFDCSLNGTVPSTEAAAYLKVVVGPSTGYARHEAGHNTCKECIGFRLIQIVSRLAQHGNLALP